MKKRFFQELFFKDFSLSVSNLNCTKLFFFRREQIFIVLNFNAGHLGGKRVTLNASNLEVRRTKPQNRNLWHRFNSGNVGIKRSTLSFPRVILIKIQVRYKMLLIYEENKHCYARVEPARNHLNGQTKGLERVTCLRNTLWEWKS